MQTFRVFQRSAAAFAQQSSSISTFAARQPRSSSLFSSSSSPLLDLLSKPSHRSLLRRRLLLRPGRRRPFSSKPEYNPTKDLGSPSPSSSVTDSSSLSLSQRLRKLGREYGWSAFGVYMALSAVDLPFCFLAVNWMGAEKIGEWEHAVVQWVRRAIPLQWPEKWGGPKKEPAVAAAGGSSDAPAMGADAVVMYDHGIEEAENENSGDNASLWTRLALAYAIHKSFIFVRVPLTAAILPKVVRTLRSWGYNIGKRTPKAERLARKAEIAEKAAAAKR